MRKRSYAAPLVCTLVALALLIFAADWRYGDASSHREAPQIMHDPAADNTDVYAFVSPEAPGTVTLISDYIPLEEPAGGPYFYRFDDNVRYAIHVDNNGDAREDITFVFEFETVILNEETFLYNTGPITSISDPNYNFRQTYSVTRVDASGGSSILAEGMMIKPPEHIGPRSTPNYESLAEMGVYEVGSGMKVFAGQRDDPFWVDTGSIFDLLGLRPFNPEHVIPLPAQPGIDGLGGFNVHTTAIQLPIEMLTADGQTLEGADDPNAVIGVWSTTSRPAMSVLNEDGTRETQGEFVQVSRLGLPLVNEVIIPLAKKDLYNASEPIDDQELFLEFFLNPEPAELIEQLYGIEVPEAPREDLVPLLIGFEGLNRQPGVPPSDMLRLNMAIAPKTPEDAGFSRMGVLGGDVSGFPNGRRVYDDVVDIELQVLAGVLIPEFQMPPNSLLSDGVPENDREFMEEFPYLATPWQGYEHEHHPVGIIPPPLAQDTRPPECEIAGTIEGPPEALEIRVQDTGSGLATVDVLTTQNATVAVPDFGEGTTDALTITATKIDQDERSTVVLEVSDVMGNSRRCDPVVTTLSAEVPEKYGLDANYPNPFNPTTTIRFHLPEAQHVRLAVYDMMGREVALLTDEPMEAGTYAARWNGRDGAGRLVASGVYLYRLTAGSFTEAKTMTLLK